MFENQCLSLYGARALTSDSHVCIGQRRPGVFTDAQSTTAWLPKNLRVSAKISRSSSNVTNKNLCHLRAIFVFNIDPPNDLRSILSLEIFYSRNSLAAREWNEK